MVECGALQVVRYRLGQPRRGVEDKHAVLDKHVKEVRGTSQSVNGATFSNERGTWWARE